MFGRARNRRLGAASPRRTLAKNIGFFGEFPEVGGTNHTPYTLSGAKFTRCDEWTALGLSGIQSTDVVLASCKISLVVHSDDLVSTIWHMAKEAAIVDVLV
jgi:hypothetical protein